MKESSTEPPLKKLKQARLPFQILSSPVVKNVESPPSQCKRKTCEVTSDDDVIVNEVNENQIKPAEKKAKVITKNGDQEKEIVDGVMEVEEPVSATKQKKKTESNSNNKVTKSTTKRKYSGKKKSTVTESKNEKANNIPVVLDYVDLSDSPVKTPCEEKESAKFKKLKENSSKSDDKGNQSNEDIDGESVSKSSGGQAQEISVVSNSNSSEDCSNRPSAEHTEENSSFEKATSADADKSSDPQHVSSNSPANKSSAKSFKQPSIANLVNKTSKVSSCGSASIIQSDEDNAEEQHKSASQNCTPSKSADSSVSDVNLKTPSTADDSMTFNESSPESECNTSTVSTPGSDPVKKISKTPRRMTPKQLLKLKEKEDRKKERERLREEKEKKKAEEKEEKLKQKKEKEEEKMRQKQEKEDEKRREKEEKEKKKQAELDQKNEEKRLKEEEKRQKEEEKKAKDEEKRKKEEEERKKKEEKRLKEEQKEAEKRKSAQAFASFFVKAESKPTCVEEDKENTPSAESNFQPFEVKNDMRLAPLVRCQLPEARRQLLDSALAEDGDETRSLYLTQIRSPSYVCGTAQRTYPPPDETDDEVIIIESEKPNEDMELGENEMEKKPEKRQRRAKLLQFHENRRPPYWGTWRKKSKHIRPRAPLNQDKTMLEYEVDSDDEWEEPEDGESLRGSDEEEEQDEQYEEDNDMFVPHGYLSDGEGEDELDDHSPESMKAKLKLLQLEFEAERKEKQEKLKPRLIGCVWFCNSEVSAVNGSKIAELFLARRTVYEGTLPITVAASLPSSPSLAMPGAAETPGSESRSGKKKKVVKESLIPDIIRKMHGSRKKLSKLLSELLEAWDQDKSEALPSKNCLVKRIRELATWERPAGTVNHCWYVKEEVRAAYGLVDLDLPPPPAPPPSLPSPAANITKFTKVLTTDERLKLLRESPSAKEVPKEASKTPSTSSEKLITPSKKAAAVKLNTPSPAVKTPTIKLNSSPVVKKRVSLVSVGPKESTKPSATNSIMSFITKSAKSGDGENENQESKVVEKVKKRITPITLTPSVPKSVAPVSSSLENDCVIIDD